MRRQPKSPTRKLLEYDSGRRRLWIHGQRCHHGAAGSIVVTTAFGGLVATRVKAGKDRRPLTALVLAGWAMMAHDWKDRSVWFARGRGSELA